jgi:hypothetical protein
MLILDQAPRKLKQGRVFRVPSQIPLSLPRPPSLYLSFFQDLSLPPPLSLCVCVCIYIYIYSWRSLSHTDTLIHTHTLSPPSSTPPPLSLQRPSAHARWHIWSHREVEKEEDEVPFNANKPRISHICTHTHTYEVTMTSHSWSHRYGEAAAPSLPGVHSTTLIMYVAVNNKTWKER